MAFTDYKPLDFSGLDKSINSIAQKRTLASLGQGLDGTPEGYAKAGQSLLALGDVQGAQNFFALGEKARERMATEGAIKSSPFSSGSFGTPRAPVAPALEGLGMPRPGDGGLKPVATIANSEAEVQALEGSTGTPGQQVAARLVNNGLTPTAAAGMASNLNTESRFRTDARNPGDGRDGSDSIGMAQWNGPRAQALQQFASSQGKDWRDPNVQADFIAYELRTTEGRTGSMLNNATTPEQAGAASIGFFRPQGYTAANPMGALGAGSRVGDAGRFVVGGEVAPPADRFTPQLSQVAQAAPAPGQPVADVPAQGAAPVQAQFAIPGPNQLPPNDPVPGTSTAELLAIAANPKHPHHALAMQVYKERQAFSAENAPDKRALTKAQADKAQLELEQLRRNAAGFRSLVTAEERAAAGIPADDKRVYQIGPDGKLTTPPGGTTVNVDSRTESEYAKANGKAISERFSKIVEEGDAAQQEAGAIARLRELGGSIKNMGAGAALQARLAEYGIKVGENVSEIEAYNALVDKLTPQQRIAGAGATSDFDAKMFKNSLPGLVRTPQGNAIILDTLEALNTYKRQRADIVAEAMASNEKPADVLRRLKELPDPFAGFKEAAKATKGPNEPAAAPATAKPAQGQPRAVATPQDYEALKSGDTYVDPQGNIRTKR